MAKRSTAWHQDADPTPQIPLPPYHQSLYQTLRKQLALGKPIQSPLVGNSGTFTALDLNISVSTVPEDVLEEFSEFKKAVGWASSQGKKEKIQEFKQFSKRLEGVEPDEDEIPDSLLDLYLSNWQQQSIESGGAWPNKAKGSRLSRRHDTGGA